ncbi:MAG: phosphodiester glycosidase family protein [candidate division Zixibacteria bacterium]|nr:phosphodiester glycosidase family protein [Candidatus Tariuqbacter arcticus]
MNLSRICRIWMSIAPLVVFSVVQAADSQWIKAAEGLEVGRFKVEAASNAGDSTIVVIRIDPEYWELILLSASETDDKRNHTAKDWCAKYGLTAAFNAGMYAADHTTHIGYMRNYEHLDNPHKNSTYLSAAAFNPKKSASPAFRIFDLDEANFNSIVGDYNTVIQNLRLIKRPGNNRWEQQSKKWSEAALGEDKHGNILFIFCRSPYSMHDFNRLLLDLPIDIVCAQHLEGGPEAQLYFNYGEMEISLCGSYETGFFESDLNFFLFAVPNIIGVKERR